MPVMDGYQAARQIHAREKAQNLAAKGLRPVPIIVWSANAFDEDREKSFAAGMNDHLVKGAKSAQIRDAIARWGDEAWQHPQA